MDVAELKFVIALLSKPDYRAPITEIKPEPKTSALERDRICRELRDRQLVNCMEEVLKLQISATGESLLRLDPIGTPITPQELKALRTCRDKQREITPKQTGLNDSDREWVIPSLLKRGWLEPTKSRILEVWLTEKGKYYLAEEYLPPGNGSLTLTINQMRDYLQFLRDYFSQPASPLISPPIPANLNS
ncbi:MAG: hypothetical protein HC835_12370 [Oscillatoriales cyanobacterium RM2_1_1]|nr:hypothetical protein [Oscillatoriales cyanobacterium SM2_3_0]NJO46351.1 hypothetical protein [Oscillatoriales cyanobacterium RM2_1_1]